jgi:hypothetical protein
MHTDALILAIKHEVPSPIQAEAHALSLAGHLAAALELQEPVSSWIARTLLKQLQLKVRQTPPCSMRYVAKLLTFRRRQDTCSPEFFMPKEKSMG